MGVTEDEAAVWKQQIDKGLNCPVSSGAGRLFDSVAALLGCAPMTTTYEGQPAIRLEALARHSRRASEVDVPFRTSESGSMLEVDWAPFFSSLPPVDKLNDSAPEYAAAFHRAFTDAALKMIDYARQKYPFRHVALSGGVMMNRIIHADLAARIEEMSLFPLTHAHVPPNDGCISLGQAIAAGYDSGIQYEK